MSAEVAKSFALSEFEKYRIKQDVLYESDFDRFLKQVDSIQAQLPLNDEGEEQR